MKHVSVNGNRMPVGCYVGGHWGQYIPDRLADVADGLGWVPAEADDDPRDVRVRAEASDDPLLWEMHLWASDAVMEWLNDHTSDDGWWMWLDGEIFLVERCGLDDCDSELCLFHSEF